MLRSKRGVEEEESSLLSPITPTPLNKVSPTSPTKRPRLVALDVLRGLTIMFMIFVNNQKSGSYYLFNHAEWNGLTPTDFVFPFFLWIMGYSIGIVLKNYWKDIPSLLEICKEPVSKCLFLYRKQVIYCCGRDPYHRHSTLLETSPHEISSSQHQSHTLFFFFKVTNHTYQNVWHWIRVLRRSVLLFMIGWVLSFLDGIPSRGVANFRVWGVLQRLGTCYLIVAVIEMTIPWLFVQLLVIVVMQVVYIAVMFGLHVPNCGKGIITMDCSAESYIDQLILTRQHTYEGLPYDPEGFLSTLSAVCNTFMGLIYFKIADRYKKEEYKKLTIWFLVGYCLILVSLFVNTTFFPYNKKIWSTSFALVTSGSAGVVLALFSFLIDTCGLNKIWTQPFIWFGNNPLLLYIMSELEAMILDGIITNVFLNGEYLSLGDAIYNILYVSWLPRPAAAALYAAVYVLSFYPLAAICYRYKIFLKL